MTDHRPAAIYEIAQVRALADAVQSTWYFAHEHECLYCGVRVVNTFHVGLTCHHKSDCVVILANALLAKEN